MRDSAEKGVLRKKKPGSKGLVSLNVVKHRCSAKGRWKRRGGKKKHRERDPRLDSGDVFVGKTKSTA